MTVARFIAEREVAWQRLADLLRSAKGRPERLGADGVRELGRAHRAASADLARARREFPGSAIVDDLDQLVEASRSCLYARTGRRRSTRLVLGTELWRAVADLRWWLALSAAALFLPLVVVTILGAADPELVRDQVPAGFIDGADLPEAGRLTPFESAAFSFEVLTNNVRVTLLSFVLGTAGVLGAPVLLVQNGISIGAVFGVGAGNGNLPGLLRIIVAHGILELSCIVVGAAAGMRAGWRLVRPGRRTRPEALREVARPTTLAVAAAALGLVGAGLLEGFASPSVLPAPLLVLLGVAAGAAFWVPVLRARRAVLPPEVDGREPARIVRTVGREAAG